MKSSLLRSFLASCALLIYSCAPTPPETPPVEDAVPAAERQPMAQPEIPLSTVDIDTLRAEIEALDLTALELSTDGMRAKIRQKWSKLHYYVHEGVVVRIKTYPHPGISKRTEEFYADTEGLILAVIEDDGDGPKGKAKQDLDKLYYYNHGAFLAEFNKEHTLEYTIENSDARELLSEFNEYMEMFAARAAR